MRHYVCVSVCVCETENVSDVFLACKMCENGGRLR